MTQPTFDPDDDVSVRRVLTDRRKEIQGLVASTKESRDAVELDQSTIGRLSRMDAIQSQEMALETDRRRSIELTRIDSALRRLDAGDYGTCVRCGEEITPERLTTDPAATVCIDCAASS